MANNPPLSTGPKICMLSQMQISLYSLLVWNVSSQVHSKAITTQTPYQMKSLW